MSKCTNEMTYISQNDLESKKNINESAICPSKKFIFVGMAYTQKIFSWIY